MRSGGALVACFERRALVGAELVNENVCEHMGAILSYEVSLPDPKIMARHTQRESKRLFANVLGCELEDADDRCAARWQQQKSK